MVGIIDKEKNNSGRRARSTTAACGGYRKCELSQRSKLCEVKNEQTILGTARGHLWVQIPSSRPKTTDRQKVDCHKDVLNILWNKPIDECENKKNHSIAFAILWFFMQIKCVFLLYVKICIRMHFYTILANQFLLQNGL